MSRSGSRQEVISTDPPQCECEDCPLPTSEGITEAQTDTVTIPDPVSSETDVPVRIVLSPEVETSRNVEESEADMGEMVMKFSEEWKIVCPDSCRVCRGVTKRAGRRGLPGLFQRWWRSQRLRTRDYSCKS